ncbi:MAG: ATP-binding cassette domain-containing protein [Candidatus Nealsonbacteria bacterium]|nr:ATP-binding cassette domain-containing protein [Candidatus Nealsonbacteria bacterium]
MNQGETILRFAKVSFNYGHKPILDEVDFSVRQGSKITLMGQNGAGKSTIFQESARFHGARIFPKLFQRKNI